MKINKKTIIIVVILVIGIGSYLYFHKTSIQVKKISLEKKIVQRTISASGIVKSRNDANLSFSSMGRVEKIFVDKNTQVKKGQLLAIIDNYSDQEGAQSYKDARDVALRDRDLFIKQYQNDQDAAGGKDEYQIQLRRYNELISKAEAAYQAQLGIVSKGYIYAPFDGVVVDEFKKVGETAGIGENILKIADLNELYFETQVDQEDFGYLQLGQTAEVTLDSYPNEKFEAKAVNLPIYSNVETGNNFNLELDFSGNNKDKIFLGMSGDAYIILAQTNGEVEALTFDEISYDTEDKPYVFVIDNNKLKKVYLDLGLQGDIYTQILTPINDQIVTAYNTKQTLEEGARAKIVQ